MRFKKCVVAAVVLCGGLRTLADPLPTETDLQQSLVAGDYKAVILGANQLLADPDTDTNPAEHAKILALKAEAHLQVKAFGTAADTFAQAAKLTTDEKTTAKYAATALLIRRSSEGVYTPKAPATDPSTPTAPVDIVAWQSRQSALAALFNDQLVANQSKLKSGADAETIPQILRAMDTVQMLRQIELAATGKDDQMKEQSTGLSDRAYTLMDAGVKKMGEQVGHIAAQAERSERNLQRAMVMGNGFGGGPGFSAPMTGVAAPSSKAMTLTSSQKSELNDVVNTAQKVKTTAGMFAKLADDAARWTTLSSDSDGLVSKAQDVLNGNYADAAAKGRNGQGGPAGN